MKAHQVLEMIKNPKPNKWLVQLSTCFQKNTVKPNPIRIIKEVQSERKFVLHTLYFFLLWSCVTCVSILHGTRSDLVVWIDILAGLLFLCTAASCLFGVDASPGEIGGKRGRKIWLASVSLLESICRMPLKDWPDDLDCLGKATEYLKSKAAGLKAAEIEDKQIPWNYAKAPGIRINFERELGLLKNILPLPEDRTLYFSE